MGLLEAKAGDFADGKSIKRGPKRVIVLVVWLVGLLLCISAASPAGTEKADSAGPVCVVEVEEVVTRYRPANNGAGPLWCYGSAVINPGICVWGPRLGKMRRCRPARSGIICVAGDNYCQSGIVGV